MLNPLVTTYVDSALAQLRRLGLMSFPGKLPAAMRDDSIPPVDDWIGWKAIPSTVTDADLSALERETGLLFPPLYYDFLRYRHFVGLTEFGVRFERHLSDDWPKVLREMYFNSWPRERILDAGLLPFGAEAQMDAGPVCFDTKRINAAGDSPVVFWDHEWVGTAKEVRPLFSSCVKMFECLSIVTVNDCNFIYHDDRDDAELLPRKRSLLAEFLRVDPEGAGGPARDYWTCWGVTPA